MTKQSPREHILKLREFIREKIRFLELQNERLKFEIQQVKFLKQRGEDLIDYSQFNQKRSKKH